MTQQPYEKWIEKRRDVSPPATLADQVMQEVARMDQQRREIWSLRLIQQIERSRVARWCVCCGALAIGSLPFFLFVRAAQL